MAVILINNDIMADLELNNPAFEITVQLQAGNQTLRIQPDETSDGVEYFICYAGENKLTQIRLDENSSWEQLWGELSQEDINAIGQSIKENR